mmetsp:Transcript_50290/g.114278  ORF Transcript_50290/g.114278 Transcript_50290/m.114278 type:complete len:297 (-) Transcript_50290:219-1109(-)
MCRRSRAWCRVARVLVSSCIKDSPEGKVFLNISRASSLFSTLMVSAKASSSSERVFLISSYSFALVSQFFASSAEYPSSSSRVLLVSSRSFFNTVMCTASWPARSVFSSIASWAARISLFLAATSPLKLDRDSCSLWVISSRRLFISSLMVFRIPTISPLAGRSAEDPDWKKAFTAALSSSITSTLSSTASTVLACAVCKNPVIPLLIACTAWSIAAVLALMSAASSSKALFSFFRWEVPSSMAWLAPARSSLCCCSSVMVCVRWACSSGMSDSSCSILALPVLIDSEVRAEFLSQ